MKLQCTQCHNMVKLTKEEANLHDEGFLTCDTFICSDCLKDFNGNQVETDEFRCDNDNL